MDPAEKGFGERWYIRPDVEFPDKLPVPGNWIAQASRNLPGPGMSFVEGSSHSKRQASKLPSLIARTRTSLVDGLSIRGSTRSCRINFAVYWGAAFQAASAGSVGRVAADFATTFVSGGGVA
jgi:hypothetical protein